MSSQSLLGSCFDPNRDTSTAAVGAITTYIRTGDMTQDREQSKFFIESVLLFLTGKVHTMGFAKATPTLFAVRWSCPVSGAKHTAMMSLQSGKYTTDAPNNFALHGFGLCAIGAALSSQSSAFRTAWVDFLTSIQTSGVDACTDDSLAAISSQLHDALIAMDPQAKTGHGWYLEETKSLDIADDVVDLRHHMVSVESFLELTEAFKDDRKVVSSTRFQGPQLRTLRSLMKRRKHTVLLGPPGVGKTVSAFEAFRLEGYETAGKDYQLFTGHDEVKSADFLGGWQPTGTPGQFTWVNGCLVRAMTANDGRGQPILVEEFTRMPTRAQNMFISALSDGYVVLNEKPDANGLGEVIYAGPEFVLVADMNVDPSADDLDMFGAAFSSRVRKIEYEYPSLTALSQILENEVPDSTPSLRQGVCMMYDSALKAWKAQELPAPISPRACVQWMDDILAMLEETGKAKPDSSLIRLIASDAAALTWLRDVAGTNPNQRKTLLQDVEASFRRAFNNKAAA